MATKKRKATRPAKAKKPKIKLETSRAKVSLKAADPHLAITGAVRTGSTKNRNGVTKLIAVRFTRDGVHQPGRMGMRFILPDGTSINLDPKALEKQSQWWASVKNN